MAKKIKHPGRRLFFTLFVVMLLLIFIRIPRNDRNWVDEQSILASAQINNTLVTIQNVRNYSYDPLHVDRYNRTYDTATLKRLWYIVEPFDKFDGFAHTFFSFEFENGTTVAVSVEGRFEKNETFSPFIGLWNRYEIIYIWGDERDLINKRIVQGNPLYMYPINTSSQNVQKLFMQMVNKTNKLQTRPDFYNTLFTTCTTELAKNANEAFPGRLPWSIAWNFPGYAADYLYDNSLIDTQIANEKLQTYYNITARAKENGAAQDFSTVIRQFK
ncbi:MAG TPA: DUF4105 domain-containing protein [Acidobacteriota bacterium]|nr:DUF4105 domain-containing protein [Acidobacteriota bacterium]